MSRRNSFVLDEADSGDSSDDESNSEPSHSGTDSGSNSSKKSDSGSDSYSSKSGYDSDSSESSFQEDEGSCSTCTSDDDHASKEDEDKENSDENESNRSESLNGRQSRFDKKAPRSRHIASLEGKLGIFKKLGRQGGMREEPNLVLTEELVTEFFLRKSPFIEPDYGLPTELGPLNIKWIANQYRKILDDRELGNGVVVEQNIWAVFAKVAEEKSHAKHWNYFFHEDDKLRWYNILKTYFQCPAHISLVRCEGVKIWWQLYCTERNREHWLRLEGERLLTKMRLKSRDVMTELSRIFLDQKSRGLACAILVKLADAANILDELPCEIFDDARETLSLNWLMWSKRLSMPENLTKYYENAIQGSNNEDDEATCAARLSNEKLYKLYKTTTIWTSGGTKSSSASNFGYANAQEAEEAVTILEKRVKALSTSQSSLTSNLEETNLVIQKEVSLLREARTKAGLLLRRERVEQNLLQACGSLEKANELAIGWLAIAAELKNRENAGDEITEEEVLFKWKKLNRIVDISASASRQAVGESQIEEITTSDSAYDGFSTGKSSIEPTLARESSVLDTASTESTGATNSHTSMKESEQRQKDFMLVKESERNEETRRRCKNRKKRSNSSKVKKRSRLVIFSEDSDDDSERHSPTEKGTPKRRKLLNK